VEFQLPASEDVSFVELEDTIP